LGVIYFVIGLCSQSPFAGAFKVFGEEYMQKLAITASAGVVAGCVTAELFGGSFGEGAAMGAASAAAGYAVSVHIDEFLQVTAEQLSGALDIVETIVDDLVSHFRIDDKIYCKCDYEEDWRVVNLKTFKSRNYGSGWPWERTLTTWDKYNIHLGADTLDRLKQIPASRDNPITVKGGRLYFERPSEYGFPSIAEFISHECGHTSQAAKMGIFYLPIVGPKTFQGERGSYWERDASLHGMYGGFVK
jgi:hypothetical protein